MSMRDTHSRGKLMTGVNRKYGFESSSERGYTLLEVIIVAAIIGILLTIGTAHYLEAQRLSIEHLCATKLANIGAFEKMYYREFANYATFQELQDQGFIDKAYWAGDDVMSHSTPFVPEYWLEFNITGDTYQVVARPVISDNNAVYVRWRVLGGQENERSMYIDQDGVVRYLRNGRPVF